VDDELRSGDADIRLTLIIYYLVLTMCLMNIVIAVMNAAMTRAAFYGPLTWLSNRLWAATTAENLSMAAWRFREQVDLYPQYVYYKVPQNEAQEFEMRYPKVMGRDKHLVMSVGKGKPSKTGASYVATSVPLAQYNSITKPREQEKGRRWQEQGRGQGSEVTLSAGMTGDAQQGLEKPIANKDSMDPLSASGRRLFDRPSRPSSSSARRHDGDSVHSNRGNTHENYTDIDHGHWVSRRESQLREELRAVQETEKRQEIKMNQITSLLEQQQQQLQLQRHRMESLLQQLLLTKET